MLDILTFFVFFTLACKLEISVVKTKNQHWIGFQYRTLYISYAEPADSESILKICAFGAFCHYYGSVHIHLLHPPRTFGAFCVFSAFLSLL